jgi:hypothetical protein
MQNIFNFATATNISENVLAFSLCNVMPFILLAHKIDAFMLAQDNDFFHAQNIFCTIS